jgi:hypothetical protein
MTERRTKKILEGSQRQERKKAKTKVRPFCSKKVGLLERRDMKENMKIQRLSLSGDLRLSLCIYFVL